MAGGNLSAWIRGRCNEPRTDSDVRSKEKVDARVGIPSGHRKKLEADVPSEPAVPNISKKSARCKHGTAKGWNCWQCGGIAVIE